MAREALCDRVGLAAARVHARTGDDCDLGNQHRGILDEHAVGVLRERRQPFEPAAERGERRDVGSVLHNRTRGIDRRALEEAELARGETRADLSDEGKHEGREYTGAGVLS